MKLLEECETETMDKIATGESTLDHLDEPELLQFVEQTKEAIEKVKNHVDAAKELKRLKMGWLAASATGKDASNASDIE